MSTDLTECTFSVLMCLRHLKPNYKANFLFVVPHVASITAEQASHCPNSKFWWKDAMKGLS